MIYNVLKKTYPNGHIQYTVYHYPIITSDEKLDDNSNDTNYQNNFYDKLKTNNISDEEKNKLDSDRRALKKIYDYARSNEWELFVTLTFSPDKCNRYNYDDVCKKLSKWLNNFSTRYCFSQLKWLLVPELHEDGAFHFHGFFLNFPRDKLKSTGQFDDEGRSIFTIPSFTLGRNDVTIISDVERASSYICKYVTKGTHCLLKGKRHYLSSQGLSLPEVEKFSVENNHYQYSSQLMNDKNFIWGKDKSFNINGIDRDYTIIEMKGEATNSLNYHFANS